MKIAVFLKNKFKLTFWTFFISPPHNVNFYLNVKMKRSPNFHQKISNKFSSRPELQNTYAKSDEINFNFQKLKLSFA